MAIHTVTDRERAVYIGIHSTFVVSERLRAWTDRISGVKH
jgi:hypothetical protein